MIQEWKLGAGHVGDLVALGDRAGRHADEVSALTGGVGDCVEIGDIGGAAIRLHELGIGEFLGDLFNRLGPLETMTKDDVVACLCVIPEICSASAGFTFSVKAISMPYLSRRLTRPL